MVQTKYSSAIGLALLLTVATAAETQIVQAQTTQFKLPESVPQGTKVRIDGSSSMSAVNDVLKQRFEQQFNGTQVEVATNGTPAGLQAVLDGKVDLAAIGRPLTAEEKAKGLNAVQVGRDKIAILVGANSPFTRGLTINQFAQIFRGEVTNWNQVGGPSAAIRFVDRPNESDTRQAFANYPAFEKAKFETGKTAQKLKDDTTQSVLRNLGANGISYSTANQVRNQKGVRVVPMHGTQPTDARYPFSQPLYYVYKGSPNEAIQAFLGLATSQVGQKAIEQAGVADAIAPTGAKAEKPKAEAAGANKPATTSADKKTEANKAGADKAAEPGAQKDGNPAVSLNAPSGNAPADGQNAQGGGNVGFLPWLTKDPVADGINAKLPNWLWWLLPIGSGAALLWLLGKGRRRAAEPMEGNMGRFNPPPHPEGEWNGNGYAGEYAPPPQMEGGFDPMQTGEPPHFDDHSRLGEPSWMDAAAQAGSNTIDAGRDALGNVGNLGGAALAGGAAMAAGAGAMAWGALNRNTRSRVILQPRGSQEVEAFWDIPSDERQAIRQQGGEKLALRLYDVTDIDMNQQSAHSVQQFECDELTQRQRLPIAVPDRDYLAEVGYLTREGQWLGMARSSHVRVSSSASGSSMLGNIAKAGGAAVAGGAAITGGAADSARSFLAGDRDPATQDADEAAWNAETSTDQSSPNWFQRITQKASDTASDVTNRATDAAGNVTDSASNLAGDVTNRTTNFAGDVTQAGGAALAGGAAAIGGASAAAWSFLSGRKNGATEKTETSPFSADDQDFVTGEIAHDHNHDFVTGETYSPEAIAGEGRLVLTPRNGQWAYAYWDISRLQRSQVDRQPGSNLVLRLYDVTNAEIMPDDYQQFDVDDLALSCDVPIPLSNRSYIAEVGYVDANDHFTRLARSSEVWVPTT